MECNRFFNFFLVNSFSAFRVLLSFLLGCSFIHFFTHSTSTSTIHICTFFVLLGTILMCDSFFMCIYVCVHTFFFYCENEHIYFFVYAVYFHIIVFVSCVCSWGFRIRPLLYSMFTSLNGQIFPHKNLRERRGYRAHTQTYNWFFLACCLSWSIMHSRQVAFFFYLRCTCTNCTVAIMSCMDRWSFITCWSLIFLWCLVLVWIFVVFKKN